MSLTLLAEGMLARAKKIDACLLDHGESSTSFDKDTLDALSEELQDERWALANSANEMKRLARGAETSMVDAALTVSRRHDQRGFSSVACAYVNSPSDRGPTIWRSVS